jgi:uncharacterized membrane protein YbhN (UPF0104 family)
VKQQLARLRLPAAVLVTSASIIFLLWQRSTEVRATVAALTIEDLALLLPATAVMAISVCGLGWAWSMVLGYLEPSNPEVRTRALPAFLYTWPAHNVPGTVPYHAMRVLSADRIGASKRAVVAAIGYEAVLMLGAGSLVGICATFLAIGPRVAAGGFVLVALLPLAVLAVVLRRGVLAFILNTALSVTGRPAIPAGRLLGARENLILTAAYCVTHCSAGVAFFLILRVYSAGDPKDVALAVGAFSIAGVTGTLVPFVPSGLGVREATLVALLSTSVSPAAAVLAAMTARAVALLADLLAPGIAIALGLGQRDVEADALAGERTAVLRPDVER